MSEEERIEETNLAEFGERIIRAPRGGAFERMLCQHLVLSVTGSPLGSIIHSCRAALSLPNDVAKRLEINKRKASTILTVALNFAEAKMDKTHQGSDRYRIFWSFAKYKEKGYENYIKPWLTSPVRFFVDNRIMEDPLALMELDEKPLWERIYYACQNLEPSGYRAMLTAFTAWAFPLVEDLNQKVATQVSPTTYNEILSMFTKFKETEE